VTDDNIRHPDLEALKNLGEHEARQLKLIEGLCLNALDVRCEIICGLSADDEEWSLGENMVWQAKQYRMLMKRAEERASSAFEYPEFVVFEMMSHLADRNGYAKILPWD
jgi:hypothetical protein